MSDSKYKDSEDETDSENSDQIKQDLTNIKHCR